MSYRQMIKVAGYCRVSTDREDQANSFEAQQRYFRNYILQRSDWELYGIYADEGITGTCTKKRYQFNQMIRDAFEKRFQLIITKEVSRFSRNILDTISYTRELKAAGIGVLFLTDGINTLDPDAELRLSIMASIAQEESRRTSSRVVWGQTRQMERGVVFGHSLLGYDVKGGQISVNPEGAEIVRLIFRKYVLEQVGTGEIAAFLTKEGYRTSRGGTQWQAGSIIKILKNEKYAGDLIQRKTYTPDFLTHEKKRNTGQQPLIVIQNHHIPIVSRELWEMAQAKLIQNNKHRSNGAGHSNRYVFSGKIRCGECGSVFVGRFRRLSNDTIVRRWSCGTVVRDGCNSCNVGTLVRDDEGMKMLKDALSGLQFDRENIVNYVISLVQQALSEDGEQDKIHREIARTEQKKQAMFDSCFAGEISRKDMLIMKDKYESHISNLSRRLHEHLTTDRENELKEFLVSMLHGKVESHVFYKSILQNLTVFKDKHVELRMQNLPHIFHYTRKTD